MRALFFCLDSSDSISEHIHGCDGSCRDSEVFEMCACMVISLEGLVRYENVALSSKLVASACVRDFQGRETNLVITSYDEVIVLLIVLTPTLEQHANATWPQLTVGPVVHPLVVSR